MDLHCRACLAKCSRSVSIFSSPKLWGKNIAIAKLIMACAPIRVRCIVIMNHKTIQILLL